MLDLISILWAGFICLLVPVAIFILGFQILYHIDKKGGQKKVSDSKKERKKFL